VSDLYDDERPPVEGVRILGAEEARASLGTKPDRPKDTEIEAELDGRPPTCPNPPDVDDAEPMIVLDGGAAARPARPPRPRASRRLSGR